MSRPRQSDSRFWNSLWWSTSRIAADSASSTVATIASRFGSAAACTSGPTICRSSASTGVSVRSSGATPTSRAKSLRRASAAGAPLRERRLRTLFWTVPPQDCTSAAALAKLAVLFKRLRKSASAWKTSSDR